MINKKTLLPDEIKAHLATDFIGQNLYIFDEITSTNAALKENKSLPDGTVFVAKTQTNGRGRLGRDWQSNEDGLWFSILLKPNTQNKALITLIAGLAVCDELGDSAMIKWPNDIVLSSKKVCGILAEASGDAVIVGIGINLYNTDFSGELKDKATSLLMEGIDADKNILLSKILSRFEVYYKQFIDNGFIPFKKQYTKKCITLGKDVLIISPTESYTAKAIGISDNGSLLVDDGKKVFEVSSGEVSVRGILGYV